MKSGGSRQFDVIAQTLLALCLWLGIASTSHAEPEIAALPRAQTLFNLLLFIQWPDQPLNDNDLLLCSLSDQALTDMQPYTKQSIHGRPLRLKQLRAELDELDRCDVFFDAAMPIDTLRKVVAVARKKPLLVVLEGAHGIDRGAMIGVEFTASRPRIEINLRLLQQSRLTAHAPLLASAQRVIR